MIEYSSGMLLLVLLCSINPKLVPYSKVLEMWEAPLDRRLEYLQTSLTIVCRRDMQDVIGFYDVLENNSQVLAQLVAYLHFAHPKVRKSRPDLTSTPDLRTPVSDSEKLAYQSVIAQACRTFASFVKPSVYSFDIPVGFGFPTLVRVSAVPGRRRPQRPRRPH